MKATLYFKPNVIGLMFNSTGERDSFWTALGEHRIAAELFKERSIRFNPIKIQSLFGSVVEIAEPLIRTQERVPEASRPVEPKKEETWVSPSEIKAPDPKPAIGSLPEDTPVPEEYTPESVQKAADPSEQKAVPQRIQKATNDAVPAPKVPIPEVANVAAPVETPPPAPPAEAKVDGRTKAGRALKAKQKT
jgi:hypothetical protein